MRSIQVPPEAGCNPGDIITIEGVWNRHPVNSVAWWMMLIFGIEFAWRHCGWAFGRKDITVPLQMPPTSRRFLFAKRELAKFIVEVQP